MMAKLISERDIERTCSDWLALDGWRPLKTDPCSDRARGKGFGELGMADRLYLRYWGKAKRDEHIRGMGEMLWVEWKGPKGKPRPHQLAWHEAERARGALTLIAGVDFPASIDGFMEYYRKSRLLRRRGL